MKKILYVKFLLAYLLFAILSFVAISTIGSRIVENHLVRQTSNALYQEVHAIAEWDSIINYQDPQVASVLQQNLSTIAAVQESDIMVITPEGFVMIESSEKYHTKAAESSEASASKSSSSEFSTTEIITLKDFDPASFGPSYYEISDFYGKYSSEQLSVLFPITSDMNTLGYVSIHYPMEAIYTQREALLRSLVFIFLIIYALSLLVLVLFTHSIYLPLLKIIQGAKEYAQGNLNYKIKVDKADEIGYLASSLNYMGDELQKNNEYQNQFIANVSHDFRSPLTSIKGYAEAMSDGTIPPELYPKYLGIIKSETERLDKLTRSMLTLNSMNKQMVLHKTDFDLNSVISDTVAVFEGICRQKKVSVDLILEGETLFVFADLGKIQQVLYNLLDNAAKFSYRNSTITIETTTRHSKVYVSVKDMGEGIPVDAQHKIWDRFYKTDTSRGKDRKGTGLGLAIVKEIIQAHDQNINVISTEGVGTEFIFTLNPSKILL